MALRQIEKAESPSVREDDDPGDSELIELTAPPTLTEVGDRG